MNTELWFFGGVTVFLVAFIGFAFYKGITHVEPCHDTANPNEAFCDHRARLERIEGIWVCRCLRDREFVQAVPR